MRKNAHHDSSSQTQKNKSKPNNKHNNHNNTIKQETCDQSYDQFPVVHKQILISTNTAKTLTNNHQHVSSLSLQIILSSGETPVHHTEQSPVSTRYHILHRTPPYRYSPPITHHSLLESTLCLTSTRWCITNIITDLTDLIFMFTTHQFSILFQHCTQQWSISLFEIGWTQII